MCLLKKLSIKSLAIATDLIPAQFESVISDHHDCFSIQTKSQPNYFWGNFLVFRRPPEEGDLEKWTRRYQQIFNNENPSFYTFTWDVCEVNETLVQPFIDDGFDFGIDTTLLASNPIKPKGFNELIEVKPIESEQDWGSIPQVHYNPHSKSSYEKQIGFMNKRLESFRMLSNKGVGHRFGAFLNGKLVGDLGIYHQDGIGRFNEVATHHEFYRQGICQTLVYLSSQYAINHYGVSKLVIVADDFYHAINAYKKVGFSAFEKNYSLQWYDKAIYGNI